MDDIDELFKPKTGEENTWYSQLTDEQRAWVDRLADRAREIGKIPVGDRTAEAFGKQFGVKPPVGSTIRDTIKRLVRG
jgi:hypothetical protein